MKNLELAKKQTSLANTVDSELAEHLVGDALENIVSAFDGFGREVCSKKSLDIRFQNISAARHRIIAELGFDFADGFNDDDWQMSCRIFQKRHLLAHKMGVIDDEYVQKTRDPEAILGRRVRVTHGEILRAIGLVETMGRRLFLGLLQTK